MVIVARGYRVVPQRLVGSCASRCLHLKVHQGAFKVDHGDGTGRVFKKGKTLFVGNVDDQGGRLCRSTIEDRLRQAFQSCGNIEHVHISNNLEESTSTSHARKSPFTSRFAHICFSSSKYARNAMLLEEIPSGVVEDNEQHQANDGEQPSDLDEDGSATCGYAALIQRHRRKVPVRADLQAEVDSAMQNFENAEAAEVARRRRLLENPEDDDGFTVVTYKKKRGRLTTGSLPIAGGDDLDIDPTASRAKKRKGAGSPKDFYRFQMRESKREALASLREKFEQDKARVAKMKQQRKFKPF